MTNPLSDPASCECWMRLSALGHSGHCCFLRDDRDRRHPDGWWRPLEEVCHVPQPPTADPRRRPHD